MRRHPVHGSWNIDSAATLPQRTYLYHMRPLGIGSMLGESLTGYIAPPAEAHDVSAAMLLNCELLPRMASISGARKAPKNATFIYQSHVLNRAGEYAQNCVQVLEILTGAGNLRALTLLRLGGVLSTQHFLRPRRAWCPRCFEDWRAMDRPIYEPLFWAIETVSCGPAHRCAFSVQCPQCGQTLYTLSARSRPGYCCRCQQWLGQRRAPDQVSIEARAGLVFAQSVGDLLAAGRDMDLFSSSLFKTNLRRCIGSLTDGNVNRFCTALGITYDSGTHWLSANGRIRLDLLIGVFTQLGLSPLGFLTEPLANKDFEHGQDLIGRNTSHIKKRRAQVRLDEQLARALHAEPPVSLHEVAAQLGDSSATSLRRRNPDICDRISDRYRKATTRPPTSPLSAVPSNGVIRRALCRALAQKPRVPLKTVACNLGFRNVVSLYNRFPDLCRAFAVANKEEKAEHLAPMRAAIESALTESPPPTVRGLAASLGCTEGVLKYRFPELRAALLKRLPERKRFLDTQLLDLIQRAAIPPSMGAVAKRAGRSRVYLRALQPDLFKQLRAVIMRNDLRTRPRCRLSTGQRSLASSWNFGTAASRTSRLKIFLAIQQPSMRNSHIVDQQIAASQREMEVSPANMAAGGRS
jgi:TniQ